MGRKYKVMLRLYTLGYAADDGEEVPEVHCLGAPIFDYRNYPIAAVWCSGPAFRLDRGREAEFGEKIKEYAIKISRCFGYDPGEVRLSRS